MTHTTSYTKLFCNYFLCPIVFSLTIQAWSIDTLIASSDKSGGKKSDKTILLTEKKRARCLSILRKGLSAKGEENFWPSIHAAEALTLAGEGPAVRQFLEPKLKTENDDRKRCGLARELVRAGDLEKSAIMFGILAKDDSYGHIHACESLYKVNQTGDGKLLRMAMENKEQPVLQIMAAAALGRNGSQSAMKLLREKLSDKDPATRKIATWVLARIGNKSDIPNIRRAMNDIDDPPIRCYFEHALASLGDDAGKRALLRNLEDDNPAVRVYAATFAGDSRAIAAKDHLIELLGDKTLDVRIRAAQSLLVLSQPISAEDGKD